MAPFAKLALAALPAITNFLTQHDVYSHANCTVVVSYRSNTTLPSIINVSSPVQNNITFVTSPIQTFARSQAAHVEGSLETVIDQLSPRFTTRKSTFAPRYTVTLFYAAGSYVPRFSIDTTSAAMPLNGTYSQNYTRPRTTISATPISATFDRIKPSSKTVVPAAPIYPNPESSTLRLSIAETAVPFQPAISVVPVNAPSATQTASVVAELPHDTPPTGIATTSQPPLQTPATAISIVPIDIPASSPSGVQIVPIPDPNPSPSGVVIVPIPDPNPSPSGVVIVPIPDPVSSPSGISIVPLDKRDFDSSNVTGTVPASDFIRAVEARQSSRYSATIAWIIVSLLVTFIAVAFGLWLWRRRKNQTHRAELKRENDKREKALKFAERLWTNSTPSGDSTHNVHPAYRPKVRVQSPSQAEGGVF